MENQPNSQPDTLPKSQIQQNLDGDRNQVIGQAINSNVVNAGDNATIHLPPLPSNELDTSNKYPTTSPAGRDYSTAERWPLILAAIYATFGYLFYRYCHNLLTA